MTDERKPETPGGSEVSPKFVDEAEAAAKAAARKARDAVEAVVKEVGPIGDDETLIQNTYRKVLALRAARPRDMPDEALDEWINEHDRLEGKIGTFPAETLRDVEIKLAILCDRLRENLSPDYSGEANDIIIALAARDDLGRLAARQTPAVATSEVQAASCNADQFPIALIEPMEGIDEIAGNMVPDGRGGTLDRLNERSRDLSRQIMNTRAQSIQGLTWKLRQLVSTLELEEGVSKYEMDMARSALADACGLAGESAVMTATHSPVDLRDQWDRLRLDLEDLNRKHDQLSDSEYGKRFDDIVQDLGGVETAIKDAPANDWQTVLVKLHVAVGLAQDQVGEPDKHDHPLVELLRTVTRDVGRLGEEGTVTRTAAPVAAMTDEPVRDALNGLADSLSMVDTARHALGTILEDMSGQPGENIGFCILRTLDAAAKQGEASFDIVWKAMTGKAGRAGQ